MSYTFLVVDQNYLRLPQLEQLFATEPSTRIVIPDLAIFEMAKSNDRELTLRLSLAILAKYAECVYVSRSIGECLKYELKCAQSVDGHMLFREATQQLRRVLHAVASGVNNAELEQIIHDPRNLLPELKHDYLNHDSNKQRSLELVEAIKSEMTTDFIRRLRGQRATREEKLAFIREKAISLLVRVLIENNFTREKAISLARKKSMLLRYFYLSLWACLDWETQGRLMGLKAEKVSNDLLDREYVLSATFFDGILSCDTRVNDAYAATIQLLTTPIRFFNQPGKS